MSTSKDKEQKVADMGVFLFSMPYASPVPRKHAGKMIAILSPIMKHIYFAGDRQTDFGNYAKHVTGVGNFPRLHRKNDIEPLVLSLALFALKYTWNIFGCNWELFKHRKQVNVVICFLGIHYTLTLILGRILGKKIIIFDPGTGLVVDRAKYKGKALGKWMFILRRTIKQFNWRLAHVCCVESNYEISQPEVDKFREKIRVGNLFVDTEFYQITKQLDDRSDQVGFIGRLAPGKGVRRFVEAARLLQSEPYSYIVFGEGVLKAVLEDKIKQDEIRNICLWGWAERQEIVQALNDLKLLVLPTLGEGVPNILLEAMSCGTPVLSTKAGGIQALIRDQETGFLLADRNPQTIAQGIKNALTHPDLLMITKNAHQRVSTRYSHKSAVSQWNDILHEVVN